MSAEAGYCIWLAELCGAGSPLPKRLIEEFGSAKDVYEAKTEEYTEKGFSEDEARILSDKDFSRANMIIDYCAENHIGLLTWENEYYPQSLFSVSSPPPVLYYKGSIERLSDGAYVAAVGSRKCSESAYENGYNMCYKLACSGVSVISGVASGIDTACILGALDAGGFCVAVLGSGINILYPFDNSRVFSRLFKTGLVITEFSPFTEPLAVNFPIRNRIMAALSCAVLVIEAGYKSGALITAEHALGMGRKIYAVPGDVANKLCRGSNELIKNGAVAVTDARDIISELEFLYPAVVSARALHKGKKLSPNDIYISKRSKKKTAEKKEQTAENSFPTDTPQKRTEQELSLLNETEKAVYNALCEETATSDMLGIKLSLSQEQVLSSLTMLEIYGFAESLAGGMYKIR